MITVCTRPTGPPSQAHLDPMRMRRRARQQGCYFATRQECKCQLNFMRLRYKLNDMNRDNSRTTVQPSLFEDDVILDVPESIGHANVKSVEATAILTKASGFMGEYDYTLNPYSGCSFGCSYCYAAFFSRDAEKMRNWGYWVEVKENALENLKKLRKKPLKEAKIYMSSVTDPYQTLERKLELTRMILIELEKYHEVRLTIQTRSPLVVRDIDILKKFKNIQVNITVTTDNEDIRKAFEPLCPSIGQRMRAASELVDAQIPTSITMTPLLPIADPEHFVQRLLRTGVRKFVVQPFHPQRGKFVAGTRSTALKAIQDLGWTESGYERDLAILMDGLPGLKEGREGFAPI